MTERDAARARHPSARWSPDPARLRRNLRERLQLAGAEQPQVAATLLALRGALGMDLAAFAALTGLPEAELAALEKGAADEPRGSAGRPGTGGATP